MVTWCQMAGEGDPGHLMSEGWGGRSWSLGVRRLGREAWSLNWCQKVGEGGNGHLGWGGRHGHLVSADWVMRSYLLDIKGLGKEITISL